MSGPGGAPTGLKQLRRLARRRRARQEAGVYVIEGAVLLSCALDAGAPVLEVWAEPGADHDVIERSRARGVTVHEVAEGRLTGTTSTKSAQPVAATATRVTSSLDEVLAHPGELLLVLCDVGDPGNVGTLVRLAEAAGAGAVVCVGDTADPFGPKAVRASAGSLFAVRIVMEDEAVEVVGRIRSAGIRCVGTSPRAAIDHDRADLSAPTALVLGSEAHGLPTRLEEQLDEMVRIPMAGRAESLNVAMAGAVLSFEAARQRRVKEASSSS